MKQSVGKKYDKILGFVFLLLIVLFIFLAMTNKSF